MKETAVRLEGKVALVTGGAGGIGAAICKLFTQEGATVYICDLHVQDGETLAQKYIVEDKKVYFLPLDVADAHAWQSVLARVEASEGRLDVLVNNAGISGSVPDRMD
jgi:NAD(P)-dependent dehydrogenase (short-subunit alcohol dehydrogenase family)